MALANTSRSITDATVEMSHADKYLYDLTGFLIVRNVLSPEQLRLANAAIDSLDQGLKLPTLLFGAIPTLL